MADAAPDGGEKPKPKGRGSGRSGPGKSEASLLQALLDEAARCGAKLPDGWRCIVRPRPNGTGSDPYYVSPDGKRYRSRQEVRWSERHTLSLPGRAPPRGLGPRLSPSGGLAGSGVPLLGDLA